MSLIIQNISMSYEHTNALRSVSIVIPQGEFLSILGPSGCGKTTLLKILAGFAKPTSGTVSMDGRVYSGDGILIPPEQRNMGMVFQSFALWPHMTVRQNVEFPLQSARHRSMTKQEKKQAGHQEQQQDFPARPQQGCGKESRAYYGQRCNML